MQATAQTAAMTLIANAYFHGRRSIPNRTPRMSPATRPPACAALLMKGRKVKISIWSPVRISMSLKRESLFSAIVARAIPLIPKIAPLAPAVACIGWRWVLTTKPTMPVRT